MSFSDSYSIECGVPKQKNIRPIAERPIRESPPSLSMDCLFGELCLTLMLRAEQGSHEAVDVGGGEGAAGVEVGEVDVGCVSGGVGDGGYEGLDVEAVNLSVGVHIAEVD